MRKSYFPFKRHCRFQHTSTHTHSAFIVAAIAIVRTLLWMFVAFHWHIPMFTLQTYYLYAHHIEAHCVTWNGKKWTHSETHMECLIWLIGSCSKYPNLVTVPTHLSRGTLRFISKVFFSWRKNTHTQPIWIELGAWSFIRVTYGIRFKFIIDSLRFQSHYFVLRSCPVHQFVFFSYLLTGFQFSTWWRINPI